MQPERRRMIRLGGDDRRRQHRPPIGERHAKAALAAFFNRKK
jgi:hypothetical protein